MDVQYLKNHPTASKFLEYSTTSIKIQLIWNAKTGRKYHFSTWLDVPIQQNPYGRQLSIGEKKKNCRANSTIETEDIPKHTSSNKNLTTYGFLAGAPVMLELNYLDQ